jgi:glycosyltransferase involved in cell wall biosynthesis
LIRRTDSAEAGKGSTIPNRVDYVVGGLRISLADTSTTPGPRSHITGVVTALRALGIDTRLFLASSQPLLGGFARMPEGSAAGGALRRALGDVVRVLACAWTAVQVWRWSTGSCADIVYERAAVVQCPGLAHRRRRQALYIVESNGIFSRETACDRQALASTKLATLIERRVYRAADLVVVVSEHLRDEVCSFAGLEPARVVVVPNGVRDDAFTMARRSSQQTRLVGFAGALVPWQRLDLLVRGAALVGEGVDVEILGDGPELASLRELADQLGITHRVHFLGRVGHDAALERMAAWSAGYAAHAASSSETMYHSPLKLYEYASLGLDLIATRTPDADLLERDGVRVLRFDGDEHSVADALRRHLSELPRPAADVVGLRAHLRDRHSWSARVEQILKRAREHAESMDVTGKALHPCPKL